jgi:hypothetical protein
MAGPHVGWPEDVPIYRIYKHGQDVALTSRQDVRYVARRSSHGRPVGARVSISRGRPKDVPIEHPSKCPRDIGGCRHFYVEWMSTWVIPGTVACRPNDVLRMSNSWQGIHLDYLWTDISGIDLASLFHFILISLSFTLISFMPIFIIFDLCL